MSDLDVNDYNNIAYGINDSGLIVGYCAWFSYHYLGDVPYMGTSSGTYSFSDLGNLGSMTFSTANAINNNGQVAGYSYTGSSYHAFLYSDFAMTDLGTLGGSESYAYGINTSGQVVGYASTAGNATTHAFLYSNGTMQDLGALGGTYSQAFGINSSGQVVGNAYTTGNGVDHAFLYSGGTMFDLNNLVNTNSLGTLLNTSKGINDSGQVIANGNNGHAYILTPSLPASYLTGSYPPQFQTMSATGGNFQFSWNSVNTYPAVGYQVQYTTNLVSGPWVNLGGVQTTTSFTDTASSDKQRFYRVMLVQ